MRNQHTRDIFFFDVRINSEPPSAPRKSMLAFANLVKGLVASRATVRWSRNKTHKTYLRDFSLDEKTGQLWLLLCSADAEAPGASFMHLESDAQRDEEKRDGEGRPETSHLLITCHERIAGSGQYLALFEESPRFPRIDVERYLNFLMRQAATSYKDVFTYPSPRGERDKHGAPKMIGYRNTVSVSGHLSSDFKKDLEQGVLRGVSLVTTHRANFGFGEGKRLAPVQKQIKLAVEGSWKDGPSHIIKEALKLGKDNKYEAAKVIFAGSDKVSHTALIDTDNGNVLNDGYIKKVRLSANEIMLPEASRKLVPLLQERMSALMG